MKPAEAIAHFKTQTAAAKSLGITQPSISNWVKRGEIPLIQQLRIQMLTCCELIASVDS